LRDIVAIVHNQLNSIPLEKAPPQKQCNPYRPIETVRPTYRHKLLEPSRKRLYMATAPPDALPVHSLTEQAISAATEPIIAEDAAKGGAVAQIMQAFAMHRISLEEAATRVEVLIGNSTPLRQLTAVMNSQLPPALLSRAPFRRKALRWSEEEDGRLTAAVKAHGTDNWALVATTVGGGRTRSQCAQRWNRGLDPRISKVNWSQEEEHDLIEAVQTHGPKAWTRIASDLRDRTDVQCRFRYKFLCKKAAEAGTPVRPISMPKAKILATEVLQGPV
jgi:hypothetical protein